MGARRRATFLLGILFSIPAYRTWSDGGIDIATMAIRVAVAMVIAYLAVWVLATIIATYTPKEGPPVEEDATADEVEVEEGVADEA